MKNNLTIPNEWKNAFYDENYYHFTDKLGPDYY